VRSSRVTTDDAGTARVHAAEVVSVHRRRQLVEPTAHHPAAAWFAHMMQMVTKLMAYPPMTAWAPSAAARPPCASILASGRRI